MTAICSKCGRDCVTKLALGKHEAKCAGPMYEGENGEVMTEKEAVERGFLILPHIYLFSDRHQTKTEKCPQCNEIWADFLILDENTWVCLKCGCHFMPREKLNAVNEWKLKDAEQKRAS